MDNASDAVIPLVFYTARTTVITNQLPVEHWHTYLNDPTQADAILDRVLHSARKLRLAGKSLRKPDAIGHVARNTHNTQPLIQVIDENAANA